MRAPDRASKGRVALDKIIAKEVGKSSNMRSRLTKLDAQLKARQMNRIIEHRTDGLTFHYKSYRPCVPTVAKLVNQAMGGILQDSINEMGAKAVLKGGGNPLQGVMAASVVCKPLSRTKWKTRERFAQFGKDVRSRVVTLEVSRKALVGSLKYPFLLENNGADRICAFYSVFPGLCYPSQKYLPVGYISLVNRMASLLFVRNIEIMRPATC